jgi:CheY-like chemotaxis protein
MQQRTVSPPLRILVVDDYLDLTVSMETLLRRWGHDVRTALNGPEALRVAASYHPDVVLLDVSLPGMDGYQVARRLRNDPTFLQTFVVSVTGYCGDGEVQRSRDAGCDDHLLKPVDPDLLERLLANQKETHQTHETEMNMEPMFAEPAPPEPAPRRDVGELAESRLRGHPYLALRHVSCEYHEGVLTLRGCLPTYYLKQVAQSAVATIDGVKQIDNEIEVIGSSRVVSV